MSETYVYKRNPGRGVIWLAAAVTLALCGGVYLWGAANLLPVWDDRGWRNSMTNMMLYVPVQSSSR